jgi:hypothetical protein
MKYFPFLLLLPLLTLSFPLPTTALSTYTFTNLTNQSTPWYDSNFAYRQQITIHKEQIAGELADFPVLIRLDENFKDGAREDLHDLVFTLDDHITKLAYEVEDSSNIWVKVPKLLPEKDTILYLYYGNPTITESQENQADVWSNGYVGVWHMGDSLEDGVEGSTAEPKNNGTANGGMDDQGNLVTGKIGRAVEFDGTNDYVEIPDSGSLDFGTMGLTISMWVERDEIGVRHDFYNSKTSGSENDLALFISASDNLWFFTHDGVDQNTISSGTVGQAWTYIAGTRDNSGNLASFINGSKDGVLAGTAQDVTSSLSKRIGSNLSGNFYVDGSVDEVRLSSTGRSDAWIQTEYTNQANHDSFLSLNPLQETQLATANTLTLKNQINFKTLNSITVDGSDSFGLQLSNDNGKTYYFYTQQGWKAANPLNLTHRSSLRDVNAHLTTFPTGTGQLALKLYLNDQEIVNEVTVHYTAGTITKLPISLSDPRIQVINELHRQVFNRPPTFQEWLTYVNKLINGEKQTAEELLGAMEWARLFGS